MMRVMVGVVVLLAAGTAAAQQPVYQPPPAPVYQPPPAPVYQPPPAPVVMLTAEEAEALERGEISEQSHVLGGLVGTFFGFGIGQAVQGRWSDTGWIFTVGEAVSFTVVMVGVARCITLFDDETGCDSGSEMGWIVAGALALVGFRVWELIDVWGGPVWHNNRVRRARQRVSPGGYGLYLAPPISGRGGGVAGISLRW